MVNEFLFFRRRKLCLFLLDKTRPITALDTRQTPKEEKEKEKSPVDANNDNSRHWLTYPNPKTPQYIIDIKQRLRQLRIPSTNARPSSASPQKQTHESFARPFSAAVQGQQKQSIDEDQHNFLTYQTRETPEELRATRYRMDKNRYNPSLDNYPPRPQTCPARPRESIKPVTPEEPGNEQISIPLPKNDAWIVDEERKSTIPDHESSSILIQMVDCDGLPNEYVDALETANIAQEEYQRNLKVNGERRPDNFVYRLPENKIDSYVSQQSLTKKKEMRCLAEVSFSYLYN
jgi:hypothetical protein